MILVEGAELENDFAFRAVAIACAGTEHAHDGVRLVVVAFSPIDHDEVLTERRDRDARHFILFFRNLLPVVPGLAVIE